VDWFSYIDPRLASDARSEFKGLDASRIEGFPRGVKVVLAGHRAAGKSTLLPQVAGALSRESVDLDAVLEKQFGRGLREWVQADEASFRRCERDCFQALSNACVVAVGGGFLSLHFDLLRDCSTVVLPISFETYAERLSADTQRPRLRPELSLEGELREIFHAREAIHQSVPHLRFSRAAAMLEKPQRPRRVATLPPLADAANFEARAIEAGADVLEIRQDLIDPSKPLALGQTMSALVSKRTPQPLLAHWISRASLIDIPLGEVAPSGVHVLFSLHTEAPLTPEEALARWKHLPSGTQVKHIEPLGDLETAGRLFETQRRLIEHFGSHQVTVLPMGPLALPFRAMLAPSNALDYVALDEQFAAAPGQRFLQDARREARAAPSPRQSATQRLGILGTPIHHSRSPRIHAQPFDRLDMPSEVDLKTLLKVLHPHYRGFAVTMPFKKLAAKAIGHSETLNTLVRTPDGYRGLNTDVDGAVAVLKKLNMKSVTILGTGGASDAVKAAADFLHINAFSVRHKEVRSPCEGDIVWTWPATLAPPPHLQLKNARVAIIAYGESAKKIAETVRYLGGEPLRVGPLWLIAQARKQQQVWKDAT
jgi:shikimate kinase